MAKSKDFKNNLMTHPEFDGIKISQIYSDRKNENNKMCKRITLYMNERIYNRLSLISKAENQSMNNIILNVIENEITEERAKTALKKLEDTI